MTHIPGTPCRHTVVNDDCRLRGDTAALEEAFDQLRREYQKLTGKHYPRGKGARFHVVLTVEEPEDK
ncbi:MAG: hypothetical protein NUW01_17435 [Gemmatimonadaceae bacterium]|nr:hypothetical protein [Gemmatimonadaceae bacterium]